jgi:hypothetical protein
MIKLVLTEISYLLSYGSIDTDKSGIKQKIKTLATVFILLMLLSTFASILLILLKVFYNRISVNTLLDNLSSKNKLYFFTVSVLVGPMIEELGFRLCLRYSSNNLVIMIGALGFTAFRKVFGDGDSWGMKIILFSTVASLILSGTTFFFFKLHSTLRLSSKKIWQKYGKFILYASITIFSFFHIFNYKVTIYSIILAPIVVMPQIILGIFLSYVRLKFGILYSVILHTVNNLLGFLMYILF